jgi:hypothetical protein
VEADQPFYLFACVNMTGQKKYSVETRHFIAWYVFLLQQQPAAM